MFINLIKPAVRRQCPSHDGKTLGVFVFGPSSSHVQVKVSGGSSMQVQVDAVFPAQFCLWAYFLCWMVSDCDAGYRHLPSVKSGHALGPNRMARQPLFC